MEVGLRDRIINLMRKYDGNGLRVQNELLRTSNRYVHTTTIHRLGRGDAPRRSYSMAECERMEEIYEECGGSVSRIRQQCIKEGISVGAGFLTDYFNSTEFLEKRVLAVMGERPRVGTISNQLKKEGRRVPGGLIARVLKDQGQYMRMIEYPEVNALIEKGFRPTLKQIGVLMGDKSKQAAHEYLRKRGLHARWKENTTPYVLDNS